MDMVCPAIFIGFLFPSIADYYRYTLKRPDTFAKSDFWLVPFTVQKSMALASPQILMVSQCFSLSHPTIFWKRAFLGPSFSQMEFRRL
jgi:hypothetical protein